MRIAIWQGQFWAGYKIISIPAILQHVKLVWQYLAVLDSSNMVQQMVLHPGCQQDVFEERALC